MFAGFKNQVLYYTLSIQLAHNPYASQEISKKNHLEMYDGIEK